MREETRRMMAALAWVLMTIGLDLLFVGLHPLLGEEISAPAVLCGAQAILLGWFITNRLPRKPPEVDSRHSAEREKGASDG